jgi:hypothetical protein
MRCDCGRCPTCFSYLMEGFDEIGIEDPGIKVPEDPIEPGVVLKGKVSLFGEPDHDHGTYTIRKSAYTRAKIGILKPGGVLALAEHVYEASDEWKSKYGDFKSFTFLFFHLNDYGAPDLSAARIGKKSRVYANPRNPTTSITWRDVLFWFQQLVEAKDLSRQFGGDFIRMSPC